MSELEYRTATVSSVSFPERTIELVVMPYESETVVEHRGKLVREVISRGAFDGIQRRADKVHVNRDHDVTRVVGRAMKFHPHRDEGLVAECRIARTMLGEETLQLADEGILDASAAFAPMVDGERWEPGPLRRITRAFLGHIAMTPDPAYRDARVLAVRTTADQPPPAVGFSVGGLSTPNLDRVRQWQLQASYEAMERTSR